MYNLIITSDKKAFNGDSFFMDIDRCITEYTDNSIKEKFSSLDENVVNEIRRFPTIFAYENFCNKNPKFGIIRGIERRTNKIRIDYEILSLPKFITYKQLEKFQSELDISDWELNRTHWAVKNVDLQRELNIRKIILPNWVRNEPKLVDVTKHFFDVGLSFPGDKREYVEIVAKELDSLIGPNSYFYDDNFTAQLARPNLDTLLQDIYRNRSKLIVVFICEKYQEKDWCGIEFRAIREIIKNKQNEKIMIVRMDNGKVEGIFETDGYIDSNKYTTKEVADFIKQRLELLRSET